ARSPGTCDPLVHACPSSCSTVRGTGGGTDAMLAAGRLPVDRWSAFAGYDAWVVTERRRLDAVLLAVGSVLLVATALLARAGMYRWETSIFRAVNGLPDWLRSYLWVLNQYGVFVTIPILVLIAAAFRR